MSSRQYGYASGRQSSKNSKSVICPHGNKCFTKGCDRHHEQDCCNDFDRCSNKDCLKRHSKHRKIPEDNVCPFWKVGYCREGYACTNPHGLVPTTNIGSWQLVRYHDPEDTTRFRLAYNCGIILKDADKRSERMSNFLAELRKKLFRLTSELDSTAILLQEYPHRSSEAVLRQKEKRFGSIIRNETNPKDDIIKESVATSYNLEVYYYFGQSTGKPDKNGSIKTLTWQFNYHVEYDNENGSNISDDELDLAITKEFEIFWAATKEQDVWTYFKEWCKKKENEELKPGERKNSDIFNTAYSRSDAPSSIPQQLKVSLRDGSKASVASLLDHSFAPK